MITSFVPFQEKHLYEIELRELERAHTTPEMLASYLTLPTSGAVTMVCSEGIVAVTGFWEVNPGVIQVYVLPSVLVPQVPVQFIRKIKSRLNSIIDSKKAHRAQTFSVATPESDRYMGLMGFTCEGTLRKWTHDKLDYRVWAIVRD